MSKKNFLPNYRIYKRVAERDSLQCLIRGYDVPANDEELVRQRILKYLIDKVKWAKHLIDVEVSHRFVSNPNRQRCRSDIELYENEKNKANKKAVMVVECKAKGISLDANVEQQAKDYAIKARSDQIWISDGDDHLFLKRQSKRGRASWGETENPFASDSPVPKPVNMKLPEDLNGLDQCLKRIYPDYDKTYSEKGLVASIHKLLFNLDLDKELPYTYDGVHVLSHLGFNKYQFSNPSGGSWEGPYYSDFIAATMGTVKALSVGLYPKGDRPYLCVGEPRKRSHLLQLNLSSHYECYDSHWGIYDRGRMTQTEIEMVHQAIVESGHDDWIRTFNFNGNDRDYVYIGDLKTVQDLTWTNSKRFLANLLHYAIIRSDLKAALKVKKQRRAQKN